MSSLSQRLHLGVQQKQILTPGLVQMVTVLQLNRMELKDMILNEIAENPVLEEAGEAGEELTPEELQALLERERQADPADQAILDKVEEPQVLEASDGEFSLDGASAENADAAAVLAAPQEEPAKAET
ncbi:MAG: RNA polymerase sigma-54 factor, partial [Bryobacteraceae bacterium]